MHETHGGLCLRLNDDPDIKHSPEGQCLMFIFGSTGVFLLLWLSVSREPFSLFYHSIYFDCFPVIMHWIHLRIAASTWNEHFFWFGMLQQNQGLKFGSKINLNPKWLRLSVLFLLMHCLLLPPSPIVLCVFYVWSFFCCALFGVGSSLQ